MEKKSAKKIIKKIFYKLCFWQSKVIEFIEKGRVRKNKPAGYRREKRASVPCRSIGRKI